MRVGRSFVGTSTVTGDEGGSECGGRESREMSKSDRVLCSGPEFSSVVGTKGAGSW